MLNKRNISLILAIILILFSCIGCSAFTYALIGLFSAESSILQVNDENEIIDIDSEKMVETPYNAVVLKNGYNALKSDGQKKLYNLFSELAYKISNEKKNESYVSERLYLKDFSLNETQLRVTYRAFLEDNPGVFWLDETFSYYTEKNGTYFRMNSYYSGEQINLMNSEFVNKVNKIIGDIPKDLSEVLRELYIYDYIIDNCDYDYNAQNNGADENYTPYNSYGALVKNSAVCSGYGKAFQYLLSLVGINCVNVYGLGKDELHLWNGVQLESEWYYCDVTWGDSAVTTNQNDAIFDELAKEIVRYDYFNITYQQLITNHTVNKLYFEYSDEEICGSKLTSPENFNLFIPECLSKKYNYYTLFATYYDYSVDEYYDELCDGLFQAASKKSKIFYINVCVDNTSFSDTVDYLFNEYPYVFFNVVNDVNAKLNDNFIDKNNLHILEKKDKNVVSVLLQYE